MKVATSSVPGFAASLLPTFVVLAFGCGAAPARRPASRPTIAVLGIDAPIEEQAAARALTDALRSEAASPRSRFALAPHRERELSEMKELGNCANESASCMADIGADLEVDFMIYGRLDHGAVSLKLMDVAKRFNRRALAAPAGRPGALFAKLGASVE
jgi:hypothetical protein